MVEERLIASTPLNGSSRTNESALTDVYGRYLDAGKGRELRIDVRVKDWGWEYPTPFWMRVSRVDADVKSGVRALHAEGITPHFREEPWGAYLALDTPTGLSQDALVANLADQCWTIVSRLFPDLAEDDTRTGGHVV